MSVVDPTAAAAATAAAALPREMYRIQEESLIRRIFRGIQLECTMRGHVVSETLVAVMVSDCDPLCCLGPDYSILFLAFSRGSVPASQNLFPLYSQVRAVVLDPSNGFSACGTLTSPDIEKLKDVSH